MKINFAFVLMKVSVLILLLSISSASHALITITGKVTLVEGTYMPGIIVFVLDSGAAPCPAGTFMSWQKDTENNKSVYALLMTALTSGRRINFFVNDGDTTCKGQFIHLLAN